MKIADKYNLFIIEDCAQSALATYDNKLTGVIGHMGSFSFETKKHMTTGQGGMVVTDDKNLAIKIRKHAGLGYVTLTERQGMTSLMPHHFQNPNFDYMANPNPYIFPFHGVSTYFAQSNFKLPRT